MDATIFLLQSEPSPILPQKTCFPSEDVAGAFSRIDEYNWLHPNNAKQCMLSSLSNLSSISPQILSTCIPIGSIEFVEEVLHLAHNIPQLTPIGIPNELLAYPEWLGRKIVFAGSIQESPRIFADLNAERLFVKSTCRVKTDYTDVYQRSDPLPQTSDSVMFSEEIPIESEWRVFVFRERLTDIRCYSGNPWLLPDKSTVMSMIDAIGQKYPAYTLDVAVISKETGFQTVVIEVHNFISCGLYGAAPPLGMYVSAYHFEVQSWKNRK